MAIESVIPSNHLILCHPLLLPSVFPSIRVFSNEPALCISWPKHWSFSFSIRPSCEYSGLISFRMDWLDLLAVQGALRSLLQPHFVLVCLTVCLFRTYSLICCVNKWVGPWHHMIWVHYHTSVLFSSVWDLVSLYSAPERSLAPMLGKEKSWVLGTSPDEGGKKGISSCAILLSTRAASSKNCFQGVEIVLCRDTTCFCLKSS